jgi:hypothetical protein
MVDSEYLVRMIFSSDNGGDSSLKEELEGEDSEATVSTPTIIPPNVVIIPPMAPGTIGRELDNAETQYMLNMIYEYILDLEKQSFCVCVCVWLYYNSLLS